MHVHAYVRSIHLVLSCYQHVVHLLNSRHCHHELLLRSLASLSMLRQILVLMRDHIEVQVLEDKMDDDSSTKNSLGSQTYRRRVNCGVGHDSTTGDS